MSIVNIVLETVIIKKSGMVKMAITISSRMVSIIMLLKMIKGILHVAKLWFLINRIHRILLFTAVVSFIACPTTAMSDEYRAWTGEFMRMGAGARAMGMGGAYTAVDGDIFSAYYNPAGLSSMTERQFALSFRYMSMDRQFKHVAIGSNMGIDAGFAFSWINAGTEDIVGRDLNGNPTGTLSDSRNAFSISFSKKLSNIISFGLNSKMAFWKLGDEDAKAFGIDVGVNIKPVNNLTASFVVRDINSRFTWSSDRWGDYIISADGQSIEKEDKFPLYYTAGLSYKLFQEKLLLAATVEVIEDCPLALDLGAGYSYNEKFTVRTGLYNYSSSDELETGAFTTGFTARITSSLCVDYAFISDTLESDAIHSLSLVMNYGVK